MLTFVTSEPKSPPMMPMLKGIPYARNQIKTAIAQANPLKNVDEVLSFLPLCHIFERLFSVLAPITHGHAVNFVEKPDTVMENMIEISPTIGYAVPRIWEKYASGITIRMMGATWFKHFVFSLPLKTGQRRATLRMGFKKVPF